VDHNSDDHDDIIHLLLLGVAISVLISSVCRYQGSRSDGQSDVSSHITVASKTQSAFNF
jgi:hypothetical protein